jgi:hypothetical protein
VVNAKTACFVVICLVYSLYCLSPVYLPYVEYICYSISIDLSHIHVSNFFVYLSITNVSSVPELWWYTRQTIGLE